MMEANTSPGLPSTAPPEYPQLLSQDLADRIEWAFLFIIIPCLSFVGLSGNVASIVLLTRQGFRKSSRLLLVGLAASDICLLIGLNNFPRHIMTSNIYIGFQFSETVNYIFYILFMAFLCANYIGMSCSLLIPVFITAERILAIFIPLSFHMIVTTLRIVVVLLCLVILSFVPFIYQFLLCVEFKQEHIQNILVGKLFYTERYKQDFASGVFTLFIDIMNYLTSVLPIVVVLLGSFVISVKVIIIANRRRQLTSGGITSNFSSQKSVSKTTQTLLSVCVLYVVCNGVSFVITYLIRSPALQAQISLLTVLQSCQTTVQCINTIGNFLIYVTFNKNIKYADFRRCCYP